MAENRSAKEIVQEWLGRGMGTPEALELVSDDFVLYGPPSLKEIYEDTEVGAQYGKDGLRRLTAIDEAFYKGYPSPEAHNKTHFMIGEGDTVVMGFEFGHPTHDGEWYFNQYCMVITVKDGLVNEVREHADTLTSWRILMGTPEKHAALLDRLRAAREELDEKDGAHAAE